MAILKYSYLSFGFVLYIAINLISYLNPSFGGPILMKILYSSISLIILIFVEASIIYPEKIYKRPFKSFQVSYQLVLFIGVIVAPLVSLYYVK